MRSDFILDEINASSLQFLRSRPPRVETELQRRPLTDEHDAGRAQRSGDDQFMGFSQRSRAGHTGLPRGIDTLALSLVTVKARPIGFQALK
jgi:hypothetical protein